MFIPDIFTVCTEDGHICTLRQEVVFVCADMTKIVIPIGTTSDGASVPAVFWNLIPPFGDYWKASFLHDYLYRNTDMPKEKCDSIYLEAMLACGVEAIKAQVIYEAVKNFGVGAFRKDRN